MAQIVSVIASTHNPRIFWNRDQADPKDMEVLYATFGKVREMLAKTKPSLIVGIANDHLDNFFFDNLPTFAVGTGPVAEGPFWYETDVMHLLRYRAANGFIRTWRSFCCVGASTKACSSRRCMISRSIMPSRCRCLSCGRKKTCPSCRS